MTKNVITDEELMQRIEEISTNFVGQIDDLQAAVGLVVVGRLFGWRVMRLACSRRHWKLACNLFGDLKDGDILQERDLLSEKSVGLKIADNATDYWNYVRGVNHMPSEQRKHIILHT